MILDKLLMFDTDSAVTVTRVSTDVIDLLNAREMGVGEDPTIDVLCAVTTTFTGGTSIQVTFQGSADNSTFTDMASGPVVPVASALQGANLATFALPVMAPGQALPRYMRLNYTVVGTMTAGKLTAGLILDRQFNRTYASGVAVSN